MTANAEIRHRAITGALALAAVLVVVAVLLGDGGGSGHRLTVTTSSATNVAKGQYVRRAGVRVGKVVDLQPAMGGRSARITFELDDDVWPIPADSTMSLRWGGTVNFDNRYVALDVGSGNRTLADGAALPRSQFRVPREFDQLTATFDEPTRAGVKAFPDESGQAMSTAQSSLAGALEASPPALKEVSYVLRDLDDQRDALETVVRSGSKVLRAVQQSSPDLKALLSGAATTSDAIADRAVSLQQGLDLAPRTFTTTRDTLKRADGTLIDARRLLNTLSPGVSEVRRTAPPLTGVLRSLRRVAPDAAATLTSLRAAAPSLDPLLRTLRSQAPQLQSIGTQSVDALDCIRPYTPEIGAFFGLWSSFTSGVDSKDRLFRAQIQTLLPATTNAQSFSPKQAADLYPGLEYGFPRPPGAYADQPWFNEACGYGPDALDPAKDPEARHTESLAGTPQP